MLAKSQGPSDLEIAKIMLSAEDPAMAGQAVAAVAKDLGETKQHFLHGLELELLGHDQALALLAGVLHVVVQGVEILLDFRGPVLGRLSLFVCMVSSWDSMPSKRVFMPVALALAASASAKELISSQSLS